MIKEKKLPYSMRKFIRTQKTRIREQFLDYKKQEEMISELYKKAWGKIDKKKTVKEKPDVKVENKETKKEEVKPVFAKSFGETKKDKKIKKV